MIDCAVFDLDVSETALTAYYGHLDPGERTRAARFRHERDRRRFVARRGMLRERLARELGRAPHAIRIDADTYGKPFLPDDPELTFNLSHSHGLALCAVGRGVAIGCDVEWRDPALACRKVAARLFAPDEITALTALPEAQCGRGLLQLLDSQGSLCEGARPRPVLPARRLQRLGRAGRAGHADRSRLDAGFVRAGTGLSGGAGGRGIAAARHRDYLDQRLAREQI